MKIILIYASLFLLLCMTACGESNVPKPTGYSRFEVPKHSYKQFANSSFSFSISDLAYIDTASMKENKDWFNIVYPEYDIRIYCSYSQVSKSTINKAFEDSYRLAYSHSLKANAITQTAYKNPSNAVFGIIYDIEGDVPTPIQFYVTDSVSNFFRASLYYNQQVKHDSVAPMTAFMREDIIKMIESFSWAKTN